MRVDSGPVSNSALNPLILQNPHSGVEGKVKTSSLMPIYMKENGTPLNGKMIVRVLLHLHACGAFG